MTRPPPPAGHRLAPHTADLIIEAWGPSRTECCAQAVLALVEAFVHPLDPVSTTPVPFEFERADDDELIVRLLEEVIYVVEVLGVVPLSAQIGTVAGGGIAGHFDVTPVDRVELIGAVPKGVSRHGLYCAQEGPTWFARATVDV